MKQYIEVRGADCGPRDYLLALPALWKGLLYDSEARRSAHNLVKDLSYAQRARLLTNGIRWSLEGDVPGGGAKDPTAIREWASELVDISAKGLGRLAETDIGRPDEADYLLPLRAAVAPGAETASASILRRWHELKGDTSAWMREQTI